MNSLPRTVTRQRRGCDLNPGPTAPESSTLTTRLLSSQCNSARQAAETRPCSLCVVLLVLICFFDDFCQTNNQLSQNLPGRSSPSFRGW